MQKISPPSPVYDTDNNILGVLFATYRNQHFQEILSVQSFNNQGFSCLVNQDGEIISCSSNAPSLLQEASSIYRYIEDADSRNDRSLRELSQILSDSSSASSFFYGDGQKYYYHAAVLDNLRSDR